MSTISTVLFIATVSATSALLQIHRAHVATKVVYGEPIYSDVAYAQAPAVVQTPTVYAGPAAQAPGVAVPVSPHSYAPSMNTVGSSSAGRTAVPTYANVAASGTTYYSSDIPVSPVAGEDAARATAYTVYAAPHSAAGSKANVTPSSNGVTTLAASSTATSAPTGVIASTTNGVFTPTTVGTSITNGVASSAVNGIDTSVTNGVVGSTEYSVGTAATNGVANSTLYSVGTSATNGVANSTLYSVGTSATNGVSNSTVYSVGNSATNGVANSTVYSVGTSVTNGVATSATQAGDTPVVTGIVTPAVTSAVQAPVTKATPATVTKPSTKISFPGDRQNASVDYEGWTKVATTGRGRYSGVTKARPVAYAGHHHYAPNFKNIPGSINFAGHGYKHQAPAQLHYAGYGPKYYASLTKSVRIPAGFAGQTHNRFAALTKAALFPFGNRHNKNPFKVVPVPIFKHKQHVTVVKHFNAPIPQAYPRHYCHSCKGYRRTPVHYSGHRKHLY